jgi:hypothetical protein
MLFQFNLISRFNSLQLFSDIFFSDVEPKHVVHNKDIKTVVLTPCKHLNFKTIFVLNVIYIDDVHALRCKEIW